MSKQRAERERLLRILALKHGFVCWYCGTDIKFKEKHIDHIVPKSRDGANDISNYALSCAFCNRAKHDRFLDEFIVWLQQIKMNKLPYHEF